MNTPDKFIIIDDDESNNMLCSIVIKCVFGKNINLQTFNSASEGIEGIKAAYENASTELKTVLFLDINMPVITGWKALEMIDALDEQIKTQLHIYMLSSSIDLKDKYMALNHALVKAFIEKPLTIEKVETVFKRKRMEA